MRVVSYVRVSTADQIQGYSLAAQREAIRLECTRRGLELINECCDEGISAKFDDLSKRPGFRTAIEAVTSGQADAIIVHKLDRAARNLRVLLEVMDEIEQGLISVTENIDTTTPQGRMFTNMLGVLAQYYSDNLGQEIKKGKDQRRRDGMFNGKIPFGYRKADNDAHNRLPLIKDDVPILCTIADRREWSRYMALKHAFELNASGMTLPNLAHELTTIGFRMRHSEAHQILSNRFYLGEIPLMEGKRRVGWMPGKHDGIIDEEVFQQAELTRRRNRNGSASVRHGARVYTFTGLVRCARCHGPMYCRTDSSKRGRSSSRIYCGNRHVNKTCDQPSLMAERLEEVIGKWLNAFSITPELAEKAVQHLGERPPPNREHEVSRLQQRRRRLVKLYEWGDIDYAEYAAEKAKVEEQLKLIDTVETVEDSVNDVANSLAHLGEHFERQDQRGRNAIASRVFDEILVDGKQVVAFRLQPPIDRYLRDRIDIVSKQLQLSDSRRQK